MEKKDILKLLESLEMGESSQDEVAELLSSPGMDSLGYAVIDTDRSSRTGIPEVIYSAGKTPLQVAEISERMNDRNTGAIGFVSGFLLTQMKIYRRL